MKLKVIVDKLNIRKALPASLSDKSSIVGIANKDLIFEGEEVKNPNNPSLGKWYKDANNFYYWGNGLTVINGAEASAYPWWIRNNMYSVPDLWESSVANTVKIAILDSGISEHIDFDFNDITGYNYLDDTTEYKTDLLGHGTHLAGIIKASGKKSFGVAPNVKLFVAKVIQTTNIPSFEAITKVLEDILEDKNGATDIDIINMSFVLRGSVEDQPKINNINALLKKIYNTKNCVLVAASGDDSRKKDNSPAKIEECISVGSINADFSHTPISTSSDTLDIVAPGNEIISSEGKDAIQTLTGTSQSAAFVSGVCAHAIGIMKQNNSFKNTLLKRKLLQTAKTTGNDPAQFGFGVISPNQFINSITS